MNDVATSEVQDGRRVPRWLRAVTRCVTRERALALMGLVAALAAMPLPGHGHSPELAATLAIGALALLAGHRWALAVVLVAEIFLVGALWKLAFFTRPPSVGAQIAIGLSMLGAIPGLFALRGAAREVLGLFGVEHTPRAATVARVALAATTVIVWASPLF